MNRLFGGSVQDILKGPYKYLNNSFPSPIYTRFNSSIHCMEYPPTRASLYPGRVKVGVNVNLSEILRGLKKG